MSAGGRRGAPRTHRSRRPWYVRRLLTLVGVFVLAGTGSAQAPAGGGWVDVDYGELVDRRQPSHSGESVGDLLGRLGGRGLPAAGERPADRMAHGLLDPLVEPYAFVLADAVDAFEPLHDPPFVEVGSLWRPGEPRPVWADLLHERRFLVESDGQGKLRAFLPLEAAGFDPATAPDPDAAAEQAWSEAWPVLRHVLAAERRRLGDNRAIEVVAYPYVHRVERTSFRLGLRPKTVQVDDTRPDGLRPPLDLGVVRKFLESGLRLEGGRLEPDGSLKLLGSQVPDGETAPSMLGRPLDLSDLAVAYRAVFRGGLAEPYMSLDRGFSPQSSIVNYGGRLKDTPLGMVSLLCDIRFKTFSLGLDIVTGRDVRADVRARIPEFRSHLEHLAEHPDSANMAGQQTRLWFYPDNVDMTLSAEGDVLVLRRVRMSAASERVEQDGGRDAAAADPPWTRTTVDAINAHYDTLADFFPELDDLDQVVRLLSFFTWLAQAEAEGFVVPDLDVLLGAELPELYTPRRYPQMLAFNGLPAAATEASVEVFDRVEIGEALDRLEPLAGRPLPALQRYRRAVAALDPQQAEHAALLEEYRSIRPDTLDDSRLDMLAYRAERLRMHQRVLLTLPPDQRDRVANRMRAGEQLRVFSVGIGGLDLGMDQVLERSRGRSLGLGTGSAGPDGPGTRSAAMRQRGDGTPREAWRSDPVGLPQPALPDHGLGAEVTGTGLRRFGGHRIEKGMAAGTRWVQVVTDEDGPEARSRKVTLDRVGKATAFERFESGRLLRFRFEQGAGGRVARSLSAPLGEATTTGTAPLPDGLVLLLVGGADPTVGGPAVPVGLQASSGGERRSLEADFPREVLQRAVLGRRADLASGRPLGGLSPLPPALGSPAAVMVLSGGPYWEAPWDAAPLPVAGEEDPFRVAGALGSWWRADPTPGPSAVVGVDAERSPGRWADAPKVSGRTTLLVPAGGGASTDSELYRSLTAGWKAGATASDAAGQSEGSLVVVVSAEPPSLFAERLRGLARNPAMRGKLLAAWGLAGPLRRDLAASLLADGNLAGIGLAEATVVGRRQAAKRIADYGQSLAASGEGQRVERVPGPFVWHF